MIIITAAISTAFAASPEEIVALCVEHSARSRAEPGCEKFEVYPDANNPYHYIVSEIYETEEAFAAHQAREAASEWGQATKMLERRYTKRIE